MKKDLEKYLRKQFAPLESYISYIDEQIKSKIKDEHDYNDAYFEYLTIDNKKIIIYISTVNTLDRYISFYIYNELQEVVEMVDFLIKNNETSVIRYSAIAYESDISKIVNSSYVYQNNNLIKGWRKTYITNKEIGHYLANCDNLANISCHIENENINVIGSVKENTVKQLKLHI